MLYALFFLLKITQRSETCIKNFYSVNHISLCYIILLKTFTHDFKITFHNSHYKYIKKIDKKFVSSKKNLTFALEMLETTMDSGNKSYPHIKQN